MNGLDLAEIEESLRSGTRILFSVTFVTPESPELAQLPEQWLQIARSPAPEERRATAVALWNHDLLQQIPRFRHELEANLIDVRTCLERGCPALTYTLKDIDDRYVSWVGYDPRSFQQPLFWESFPEPLQVFLREVHAGFVAFGCEMYGIMRPIYMKTVADWLVNTPAIEDYNHINVIPAARLLGITRDGGNLWYHVSPDVPGKFVLIYEGLPDREPTDFSPAWDDLLMGGLEG